VVAFGIIGLVMSVLIVSNVVSGVVVAGYRSAGTNVPASFLYVYRLDELALLGLSGLVIAVLGALLPAGWAAKISTASALRAE
jgi:putative ABC transport system permease protein